MMRIINYMLANTRNHDSLSPRDQRTIYTVFAGLMLGMIVSSLNLTLVAPARVFVASLLGPKG
jgi:hypothetical protein